MVKALVLGIVSLSSSISYAAGGCYNLEIIGTKTKNVSMTNTSGHSLFVPISGSTKILLKEGSFGVIDRNGTDGSASFSLPNPASGSYDVFARVVGKPGTGIDMTTCAYDAAGALFCSENSLSLRRVAGTSKFVNVSRELLSIQADIDGDGDVDSVGLFSDLLQDYYWQTDTQGRVHAQLKFCPR